MRVLLSFLLLVASNAYSSEWQSNIDHSEIHFKIPYMKVSEVSGRFRDFKASAKMNGDKVESVHITIDPTTIDTGHKMRDNHLKGHDFFKSKEFTSMKFTSKKVSPKGDKLIVDGDLTIKDITRPTSFVVELTENLKDTWGYENRFAKFTGEIDRKAYDMNWNKTLDKQEFLVGDKILISGVFQIQPASSLTPNSKHMIPDTNTIRGNDLERQNKDESSFARKIRKLINGK